LLALFVVLAIVLAFMILERIAEGGLVDNADAPPAPEPPQFE